MARFQKLNNAIDRIMARMDELEAQGIDITKLQPSPEALARNAANAKARAVKAAKASVAHKASEAAAGAALSVGQLVWCRGASPLAPVAITAIAGSVVTVMIDDRARQFTAGSLKAA